MAPASRNISTLTLCQQIGNLFGQHGSSFTEYQHTHSLSTDWQFVRSAWLQLHGISAHSLSVNRLAIFRAAWLQLQGKSGQLSAVKGMGIYLGGMRPISRKIRQLNSR